jgi:hypothetical protein
MVKKAAARKSIDKSKLHNAGDGVRGAARRIRAQKQQKGSVGGSPRGHARQPRARGNSHRENAGTVKNDVQRDRAATPTQIPGARMTLAETAVQLRNDFPEQLSSVDHADLLNAIALAHMEDGYGLLSVAGARAAIGRRDGVQVMPGMVMNSQTGQVFAVLEDVDGQLQPGARAAGTEEIDRFVPPLPETKSPIAAPPAAAAGSDHVERRNAPINDQVLQQLAKIAESIDTLGGEIFRLDRAIRRPRLIEGHLPSDGSTFTLVAKPIED